MGARDGLDFTSLLDDLIAASQEAEAHDDGYQRGPSLHVDLLSQIERLQAENAGVFSERALREYSAQEPAEPQQARRETDAPRDAAPDLQPALDDLFFLDPQSIARELGITTTSKPEELDRARRAFALRYHPDRVPEDARERSALRMQIANMLIDAAKRGRR